MNQMLKKYFRKFVLIYLDNIIIYFKIFKKHKKYVKLVFEILQAVFLIIKLKKCKFVQRELQFFEHIISAKSIRTDPKKIVKMITLLLSTNLKKLKLRLNLFFYY